MQILSLMTNIIYIIASATMIEAFFRKTHILPEVFCLNLFQHMQEKIRSQLIFKQSRATLPWFKPL